MRDAGKSSTQNIARYMLNKEMRTHLDRACSLLRLCYAREFGVRIEYLKEFGFLSRNDTPRLRFDAVSPTFFTPPPLCVGKTQDGGGAVYITKDSSFVAVGCTFDKNTADKVSVDGAFVQVSTN